MKQAEIQKRFAPWKLMIPMLIGLSVVIWMFAKEFDPNVMSQVHWGMNTVLGLLGVFILVIARIAGYTMRLRLLTEGQMNWRSCLEVILLWSFASAISPSAVGGTALAIVILSLEGLSVGRSTSISIANLILYLLFFVFFSLAL